MTYGIDIDEVLAATTQQFVYWHNFMFKSGIILPEFTDFNWWTFLGGTREEAIALVHDFQESQWGKTVDPIPGSVKGVASLHNSGTALVAITSRASRFKNDTLDWIGKHYGNHFSDVRFTNAWGQSGATTTKAALCQELGITRMVDDHIVYAREVSHVVEKVALFPAPWNKEEVVNGNIRRVSGWPELTDYFLSP